MEMKNCIIKLKMENDELRKLRVGLDNGVIPKGDQENLINNLMDQIKLHVEEKDRLQAALKTLKENSMLADKNPSEKQIWVLKRTNAKLTDDLKACEKTIASLQKEIALKNMKVKELEERLNINTFNENPHYVPQRSETWTDKLKAVFN